MITICLHDSLIRVDLSNSSLAVRFYDATFSCCFVILLISCFEGVPISDVPGPAQANDTSGIEAGVSR